MYSKPFAAVSMVGVLGCCMAPVAAQANTATTTFPVTATVLKACIVTAGPLAFGSYDPTSTAATAATTNTIVTCTLGTSFQVGLNAGTTSGATVTTRQMVNGSSKLNYGLYQDSAHTTNWGNTPGTDTPAPIISGLTPSTLTVYGLVPAAQIVPAGPYTDTITVTVTY